ncbi:MAG: DUF3854 domain-containing protein [Oscillospiraceae bacterium]|nr:DUF3854 domain-containing protein [Oscillospiraceae bacterium]
MVRIRMTDIIPLIGIPEPKQGAIKYDIPCPCCDDKPKGKHLNINLELDVFRCPRCGFSGGVFDLYAFYSGVNRKNAREVLLARLDLRDGNRAATTVPRQKLLQPQSIDCPITDLDTRHETYTALLSRLSLASDHKQNLLNRGLTDEMIQCLGYKTTPMVGTTILAKQLLSEGFYLSGVPGFYHNDEGQWTFIKNFRGILIPVRNHEGKIQGLQLRRDDVSKRKFRWVSSAGRQDGSKAECWTHLVGPPQETVIITEGPMKADVIYALTGQSVLAVPGVNSLNHLKATLKYLKENGTKQIMTAFDMDYLTNPHVTNGYRDLSSILATLGLPYGTFLWNPDHKGLDDYVWEYCYHQGS